MWRPLLLFVLAALCSSEEEKQKKLVSSVFEGLGYSPVCIAASLASCEVSLSLSQMMDSNNTHKDEEPKWKSSRSKNCAELLALGDTESGVRTVYPYSCCCENKPVVVYCDQTTDGGGWTVFQNRDALPVREDFYRTWIEYVLGFGNLTGEFWLGLDDIHTLVSSTLMEMRIDLEDYEGEKRWAKFGVFYVEDRNSKYVLRIGKFSGDAGDGLTGLNGMKFTTHDQDNDIYDKNCAVEFRGAWWYSKCHSSNLNGFQYVGKHTSYADGIIWQPFRDYYYSLKKTSMKFRPVFRL